MKEAIIKATDTDSVVTGLLSGHGGVRSLKNEFTTRYLAAETDGVTTPEERTKMSQGTNKRAAIDGDVVNGAVQVGQALNRSCSYRTSSYNCSNCNERSNYVYS